MTQLPADDYSSRGSRWLARLPVTHVAVAVLLGALAVGLPVLGLVRNSRSQDRLTEAQGAEASVLRTVDAAHVAITGARGYALTGEPAFKEDYDQAVSTVQLSLTALPATLAGIPDTAADLAAMEAAFNEWLLQGALRIIQYTDLGDRAAASGVVGSDDAQAALDSFELASDQLLGTIELSVEDRLSDYDRAGDLAALAVAGGVLCAGGLAIVASSAFRGRNRALRDLRLQELAISRQSDMLAVAAHDLRNPATALVMGAELLEARAAEESDESFGLMAANLSASARRIADMMEELLSFCLIEAGRVSVAPSVVDAGEIVDLVVGDVALGRSQTAPRWDIRAPAGVDVLADPRLLRIVLRNLLSNAVAYGQSPVRVRVERSGGAVEFHVEDSGPGIPLSERERIFERFERGTTIAGRTGTGIGLYMARQLVTMQNGTLELRESPLGGSDFVATLQPPSGSGGEAPVPVTESGRQIRGATTPGVLPSAGTNGRIEARARRAQIPLA